MSEKNIPENNTLTVEALAAELVNRGGQIVCSSDCTPKEILAARRDNRFAAADSFGFVLVLQRKKRKVVRDAATGLWTKKERAETDKDGTVEESV